MPISKALVNSKGSLSETQKQQKITLVQAFLTIDALLIVDISGSMSTTDVQDEDGLVSRWEAANRQLARLQSRFPGRLAVVAFSDTAEFCPSGQLPYTRGGTNLLGALQHIKPADGCGIKFIVASDGCPDNPDGTLKFAGTLQTHIDTIFIGSEARGRQFMKDLAKASGGKAVDKSVVLLEEVVTRLLTEGSK